MTKVLLLGLGFWGRKWLELLTAQKDVTLAGVAGAKHELADAAEKYGLPDDILFDDFRLAIKNTQADIAVIVIPRALHFEADKLAMEKGMHIITEKPLALNMEEASALLEIKEKNPGSIFMTSQNYRWRPHTQAVRSCIRSGMAGKIETVLCEFRKQEDLQGYRVSLEYPLLEDVCIHHFDLIRFFTGSDCRSAYCECYRPDWSIFDGVPGTDALLEMKNGVRVTYCGTWAARGNESSWDGNYIITGTKGAITLDADDNVWFYPFKKDAEVVMESGAEKGILIEKPSMQYTEFEYGFEMMLNCIKNGTIPETTIEDNIKSLEMVCACLRSAKEQCKIFL
jgi:predicted dehydrogenase